MSTSISSPPDGCAHAQQRLPVRQTAVCAQHAPETPNRRCKSTSPSHGLHTSPSSSPFCAVGWLMIILPCRLFKRHVMRKVSRFALANALMLLWHGDCNNQPYLQACHHLSAGLLALAFLLSKQALPMVAVLGNTNQKLVRGSIDGCMNSFSTMSEVRPHRIELLLYLTATFVPFLVTVGFASTPILAGPRAPDASFSAMEVIFCVTACAASL